MISVWSSQLYCPNCVADVIPVLAPLIISSSKMIQVFFIGLMPLKALYDLRGCVEDPDSMHERNEQFV